MDTKPEHDEERQGFLLTQGEARTDSRTKSRGFGCYIRLLIEVLMAVTIAVLYFRLANVEGTSRPSPVPRFPKKTRPFVQEPDLVNDNMFANETINLQTLHKWIPLSTVGRGYVRVSNPKSYDLGEPYEVQVERDRTGPAYMMTVFHQLHCLSYIVSHYQMGYSGANLTEEIAHHSAHCFDYLRQGIMCSADTSLEGSTEAGPGWGSKHECTDYDALLEWANKNTALKWRGTMPETSIL